jgi:hypothetical protein
MFFRGTKFQTRTVSWSSDQWRLCQCSNFFEAINSQTLSRDVLPRNLVSNPYSAVIVWPMEALSVFEILRGNQPQFRCEIPNRIPHRILCFWLVFTVWEIYDKDTDRNDIESHTRLRRSEGNYMQPGASNRWFKREEQLAYSPSQAHHMTPKLQTWL